jgi:Mn-dependent DtxR family transcriptional regulator
LELRFGLAGEARKMDLRDVGKILGVSRQTVLNWIEQAIEKLWSDSAVKELWRRCGDFLEWKSGNPKVTSWSTLSEEEIALFSKPKSYEFDWPHHAVAESIEYLLLREGVKVKRNGRKITIPVNEYGRFKKAFEKHGLTVPKKYVSNEAETIRKMARFSGQMGGKVLELPWK